MAFFSTTNLIHSMFFQLLGCYNFYCLPFLQKDLPNSVLCLFNIFIILSIKTFTLNTDLRHIYFLDLVSRYDTSNLFGPINKVFNSNMLIWSMGSIIPISNPRIHNRNTHKSSNGIFRTATS